MNISFRAVFLVAVGLFSASADFAQAGPIDLTKGLGEFTWGMKRDDLLKKAQQKYGDGNVTTEDEYAGGYPGKAVVVKEGSVKTRFSFAQDQFFAFSRTIDTSLGGYVTQDEIQKAHLTDQAKALFVAPEGIVLDAFFSTTGSMDARVSAMRVTVMATNRQLESKIVDDLRAKSPSLIDAVITPLGKP